MTNKIIETTDREVGHFIEELSRIMRNVKLIKQGKAKTKDGVNRLDIIDKCAKDINDRCCKMQHLHTTTEYKYLGRNLEN